MDDSIESSTPNAYDLWYEDEHSTGLEYEMESDVNETLQDKYDNRNDDSSYI